MLQQKHALHSLNTNVSPSRFEHLVCLFREKQLYNRNSKLSGLISDARGCWEVGGRHLSSGVRLDLLHPVTMETIFSLAETERRKDNALL